MKPIEGRYYTTALIDPDRWQSFGTFVSHDSAIDAVEVHNKKWEVDTQWSSFVINQLCQYVDGELIPIWIREYKE
jgi:hypothetical protein